MTVAASRPYDVFSLLDEPLWRVLYVFHHLVEDEARKALYERLYRVDAAKMAAFALHKPSSLDDEMRDVRAAILELDAPPVSDEDRLARGLALAARIDAGRVLSDEALVS